MDRDGYSNKADDDDDVRGEFGMLISDSEGSEDGGEQSSDEQVGNEQFDDEQPGNGEANSRSNTDEESGSDE